MVTLTGWASNNDGTKAVRVQIRRDDYDVNEEYDAMAQASGLYIRTYGEVSAKAGHSHKEEK